MTTTPTPDPRRWLILAVIAVAQLMVVLDVTIVNIALPSAQADLVFSDGSRQWVVTAYALTFGSLLLLGGRISDLAGRKWTFVAGLLGFAGASAVGGAAPSSEVLVAARALQGVFAALLAPRRCRSWRRRSPRPTSAGGPSPCTARSPARAPRSGCCSAARSPSCCRGAGRCT